MAGRSKLEDLELTGEEVERLRQAFRDERFRSLLAEYAAELADPAQRATYEAEVVALERQRGVEARFLHPTPAWVLRTSQAGTRRCYLNVCSNALVGRPEARREPGGSRWALPHCLSPGREELGRRPGAPRRLLYDVLFHPDTLRLAARSARFRRLVDETALEAVERHFEPGLDRANAVPLRGTKYKGVPQASLLRTPLPGGAPPPAEAEEGGAGDPPLPPSPYAYPPPQPRAPRSPPPEPAPAAATPRWTLRQRSYVDWQDYRCSRDSAPSPVPRELEVTVELPLLTAAAQAQLEIRGQELQLDSQRPAAYRLRLRLPYPVDEDRGRATFDKSRRRLVVTLPVRPKPGFLGQGKEDPPEEEQESPKVSCAAPADEDGGDLPQDGSVSSQAGPVSHVGANHVELPVCAEESAPAAVGTSAGTSHGRGAAAACPAPADVHVGCIAEPPGCPEIGDLTAPASDSSPDSTRASDCQGLEPGSGPEGCVGNALELPAGGSITGPSSPVTQVELGTDTEKCPEVTNAMPSSDLGDATIPSADLCGITSESPVTSEYHHLSDLGQNMEICTSTGVSWTPRSSPEAAAGLHTTPSADLSVTALSATNTPPDSPLLSRTDLGVDPEAALTSPSSPAPPLCPPFQCTQDEEALVLLLQVPGIVPQSLKGEVGTNHYRVSFAKEHSVPYILLLRLSPENKLTSPEASINVSFNNAVIHLRKAAETTGLWTKLYFGLNEDTLQEMWFVTEDNVAEFLGSLQRTSSPSQPEVEHQPLIEVLSISEGQSQIRLKAQELNSLELGKAEEKISPRREDSKHPCSAENRPLIPGPRGEHARQTEKAADSLTAVETKERAGRGTHHCLELDPADSSSALPGKLQIMKSQESELAFPTDPTRAASTKQAQLHGGECARTEEDECSDSAESSRLAAPVLKETDMRDGSTQFITHHTTQCAVTFQNPLLYELD
ncbi:protein kintoun [Eublepharis macularius]|uniref:Protein kintoun n=1 Tax=Eublepharis macularius TaxID=481883 RepID=A0AA97KQQ5_EUBMA|nr:protein kintoun [Eublepharis macularius]